ncbi:hypothetical protein BV25DRAFT_1825108 [Artomyces pyxidatus]|uniref:Uncharacterized protein n=1 Tax=Artomyces pyxidatus TaxID=48021 RepID=A0ACB8T2J3_9AGAM|nr:hypothetical protein BV25DRAFT_1825108 [Artomyces pyxidatus]
MTADTNGVLVFTGLFGAIVTAFVIESYKQLLPSSENSALVLIAHLSLQLSAASNNTTLPLLPPLSTPNSSKPSASAVRVNILWFTSLSLSLACALAATLMQQWARRYVANTQSAQRTGSLRRHGYIHAYLFTGFQTFRMKSAVEALPALLHTSVALFFAGLVDFLFSINNTVASVVLACVVLGALIYIGLTFLPLRWPNCPYATPLSPLNVAAFVLGPLSIITTALTKTFARRKDGWQTFIEAYRFLSVQRGNAFESPTSCLSLSSKRLKFFVARVGLWISDFLYRGNSRLEVWMDVARSSKLVRLERAARLTANLETSVLLWTSIAVNDDDVKSEQLIESIPDFIYSADRQQAFKMVEGLLNITGFPLRMAQLLSTTSDMPRRQRALSCLHLIRCLTSSPSFFATRFWEKLMHHILAPLVRLQSDKDADVAISAYCTAATLTYFLDHIVFHLDWDTNTSHERLRVLTKCLQALVQTDGPYFGAMDAAVVYSYRQTAERRFTRGRVLNVGRSKPRVAHPLFHRRARPSVPQDMGRSHRRATRAGHHNEHPASRRTAPGD